MAPKKPNPMEDPPAASSEEEEEEEDSSSEEEDSSSSEEEDEESPSKPKPSSPPPPPQKQQQQQPQQPQQPPKKPETTSTTPQHLSSSSGSESEDSESDSPDLTVKPIATKPMEETPKTTKPRSKLASTPMKSTAKRALDNDRDLKDSKKVKKGGGSDDGIIDESSKKSTEDPKKQLFQRLWSEDDEIAVLKGMIEYSAKRGDPMADMNAFLDYIKNALHFDVTKVQLHDKIRRLKKKFENNSKKGKKGEERSFAKEHEQKGYDLSKKIWGGGGGGGGDGVESSTASKLNGKSAAAKKTVTPKANGKAVPTPNPKVEVKKMEIDGNGKDTWCMSEIAVFDKAGMEEFVVKRGLELVDGGKRVELEERWRKLQLAQLELFVERSQLVLEEAKLVLEAAKSSKH